MTATLPAVDSATVLVVEDDPGIAELERSRLEEAGYRVVVAATAEDALREVGRGGVDLVLLDYRLPGGIDGLDFYARVKAAGFDLPVILVTGFGNEATVIQAMRVGVRDFVTKSLEYLDYLPEAVARILRQVGTERRLAESEARLAGVIQSAKDAVIVVEADRRVSLFNPAAERMFGCKAAAAVGRRVTDFIPDELVPAAAAGADPGSVSHRLRTGTRGVRADGADFPVEASVSSGAAGGRRFYTLVVRDVTERKRTEQALTMFRALLDRTTDAIEVVDPATGRFLDVNETACRVYGYARDEYLALSLADVDTLAAARPWAGLVSERQGAGSRIVESVHRRKDGSVFPVEISLTLVSLDRPYLVAVVRDVTARRQAEETLRRSEALLRRAEAMAHVAGWTYEVADGVYVSSDEGARIYECGPGPQPAGVWERAVHPDDLPGVREAVRAAAAGAPFAVEHRLVFGGRVKWVSVRGEPETDAAGRVVRVIGVTQDVTGRRQLEEQFRQAQKLEAVGRLAGGVAHDFNNLLTVINGYSELVMAALPAASHERGLVGEVRDAGERAAGLTRQLLTFSRKQVVELRPLDLNEVVAHAERLLRRLIGEDVLLAVDLDPALPRVKADPTQIEQVVMNLAVNARDAMPRGGRLTIQTRAVAADAGGVAGAPDARPGLYARLAVTDTGHGMTPEVKAQLFEPFFTTKEPGRGTGLGLSVVHGVVTQSGGHIAVSSRVGVGTSFELLFPAADAAPVRAAAREPALAAAGSETVLLVEDELALRQLARIILETHGYTVLEAETGQEALRVAESHPGPIRLLLTDVVMPEMGGRELAQALRARFQGLRVLFVSGYTDDAVVRHGVGETDAFLQKPYTPLALARKVRAVLDA